MILVTAFEPFGGKQYNESLTILNRLSIDFEKHVLPVDITKIAKVLYQKDLSQYDFVIMLGEADRDYISLEQYAYNELNMRIADNAGNQIIGQEIIPGGLTFETKLDILRYADGQEVRISTDPGRYLCNMAYYLASMKTTNVIFIHVSSRKNTEQIKKVETIINEIKKTSNIR